MLMKGGVYLGTSQRDTKKTQTSKKSTTSNRKQPAAKSKTTNTEKTSSRTEKKITQEKMVIKPEKSLLRYEIELISLFALTLLSAVAIHTEWTGFFGKLMKGIYLGLFGFAGVVLTYAIFLLVFFNINKFFKDKKWRLTFGVICGFLSIWIFSTTINYSVLSQLLTEKGQLLMSSEGWKVSFEQGILLRGGGVLGNILVFGIINAIGKFGAYLLGTLFAAFSIVLIFKVSLTNLVKKSGINTFNGMKPIAEKMSHMPKFSGREKAISENVVSEVESVESVEGSGAINPVSDAERVTLSDLPRREKPIEAYNSDLYFDPSNEQINPETGEYLSGVTDLNEGAEIEEETEAVALSQSLQDSPPEAPTFIANFMEHVEAVIDEVHIEDELAMDDFVVPDLLEKDEPIFVHFSAETGEEEIVEEPFEDMEDEETVEVKETLKDELEQEAPVIKPVVKPLPKPYVMPPLSLLNPAKAKTNNNRDEIVENVKTLEVTLKNFGVDAKVTEVTKGPAITMYEVLPAPGVKVSKIVNLTDDIALALAASQIRIIAPIPGKSAIGIEIPNKDTTMVTAREVFESEEFKKTDSKLSFALGKEITGKTMVADLAKMPHLLIAGSTGSGKSVCVNTIINSILFNAKPDEVKLLMIDPKVVELSHYNGIPHLILPVVVDPKKASIALNWAVNEMTNRYKTFAEHVVKDINSYNRKAETQPDLNLEKMPKIVILVDELADLMMVAPNQVEDAICRLAQMARAAGIHLIVATQRPSVDVITGLIKANIPSRIAFAVSSQIDSRTILDMAGAEKLLGKGDMLFYPLGANKPVRIQGAFLADSEVEGVVEFVKKQVDGVDYQEEILTDIPESTTSMEADELLKDAVELVVETGQASISMLQRKFRVGYNRAARLVDQMEERGIVGPSLGSKPREVLLTRLELEQLKL